MKESMNKSAMRQLFKAMATLQNAQEAEQFLTDLCTPAELQAMADRWLVVKPIKKGDSYRKIYEDTGVSVTTVGRVARSLNLGSGGYDVIYQRLEKKS